MNPNLDELVNKWIEGDLDPESAEALRRLMAEDASARETCYDMMLLDQLMGEREEAREALTPEPARVRPQRKFAASRTAIAAVASLAAGVVAGLWLAPRPEGALPASSGPSIMASSDSRITIAQRENRAQWSPGELLRLERGTAAIQLGNGVLAHFEGPAAIELANVEGNIRQFEGRGSFQVDAGKHPFVIEAPGGSLRGSSTQFVCQILPDEAALVEVNAGSLEIMARSGRGPSKIAAGEAVRIDVSGAITPTARPGMPFRAGLPEELALFRDDFEKATESPLTEHEPEIGRKWEQLEGIATTINKRLDTSGGAKRLLAGLAPHNPGGAGSVYVFSFSLLAPAWSHDKIKRMDGIESIAIVDAKGTELFNLTAEAVNTHRWQLKGGGLASPLTPVCALWDHQLTVCYGLDGRVTLHDGGTAQAPVIASIWLKHTAPAGGILISNRTGGDLAFRRIDTSLLRAPSVRSE